MYARWLVLGIAAMVTLASRSTWAQPQRPDRAEHHQFTIDGFRTESGVVLPKAVIAFLNRTIARFLAGEAPR